MLNQYTWSSMEQSQNWLIASVPELSIPGFDEYGCRLNSLTLFTHKDFSQICIINPNLSPKSLMFIFNCIMEINHLNNSLLPQTQWVLIKYNTLSLKCVSSLLLLPQIRKWFHCHSSQDIGSEVTMASSCPYPNHWLPSPWFFFWVFSVPLYLYLSHHLRLHPSSEWQEVTRRSLGT